MTARAWGAEYRTTTVCIDSYDNGILAGRFYNAYLKGSCSFKSTTQFLFQLDQTLDAMDFPRSYTMTRTFAPLPPHDLSPPEETFRPGAKATFSLRILFRQNASWQGSVLWQEGRREQSFRSALELIFLLDNALTLENVS